MKVHRLLPLVLAPLLSGCVHDIVRDRVKDALVEAGLSEPKAMCMSRHMTDQLTIAQIRKLEVLKGVGHNPVAFAMAVRKIHDPEVIKVTLAAAAVCLSGLEH